MASSKTRVFPSFCSISLSTLAFIFTFIPWLQMAGKTSGVTILCRCYYPVKKDAHSSSISFYQQQNCSQSSQQKSLKPHGRNWITCPPPTVMPKGRDQTTGRARHPPRHQCLTPEKLGILLLRKRSKECWVGGSSVCTPLAGPCSGTGGLGQRPCLNEELGTLWPQQAKDTPHN